MQAASVRVVIARGTSHVTRVASGASAVTMMATRLATHALREHWSAPPQVLLRLPESLCSCGFPASAMIVARAFQRCGSAPPAARCAACERRGARVGVRAFAWAEARVRDADEDMRRGMQAWLREGVGDVLAKR